MPLFDHFHGPLAWRPWESLHQQWAACIAADLNRCLPRRFVADSPMHLATSIAADVVEYEKRNGCEQPNGQHLPDQFGNGAVAVATQPQTSTGSETALYSPPETDLIMPMTFPPEMLIEVKDATRQYRVVAVIELVSPTNKDRPDYRQQFAAKCLSYLAKGIGLVVIDLVTARSSNHHNELIRIAEYDSKYEMPNDPPIYVAAYRPVHRKGDDLVDLWHWPLAVGAGLPAVPLALKGYGCVKLDLEATYTEACERCRIP